MLICFEFWFGRGVVVVDKGGMCFLVFFRVDLGSLWVWIYFVFKEDNYVKNVNNIS